MDRNADVIDLLAGDRQRPQALGHKRVDREPAAVGRDLDPIAVFDALLVGKLLRQLDERLRLKSDQQRHVLCHVMLVLGQPIARRHVRELVGLTEAAGSAGRFVVEERDRRLRL